MPLWLERWLHGDSLKVNSAFDRIDRLIDEQYAAIPPRYKRDEPEALVVLIRRVVADADAERVDHDATRCALKAARDDLRAANARLAEAEQRAARYAEIANDYRDRNDHLQQAAASVQARHEAEAERLRTALAEHADAARYYGKLAEDRRVEREGALAEVERLTTLIGNARNQLDGRRHHPDAAPVVAGYVPAALTEPPCDRD